MPQETYGSVVVAYIPLEVKGPVETNGTWNSMPDGVIEKALIPAVPL
jgi:hypothetical protein